MLSICCDSSVKSWRNRKACQKKYIYIKAFINKYKWEGINFPSEKDDWKAFEKNNVTIALNAFHVKKEKISKLFFKWFQIEKIGIMLQ